jgi:hypothetical protein
LDKSHRLRYRGRYLHLRSCPEPSRATAILPTYGLQDLRKEQRDPKNKIRPKYHVPAVTLGECPGSGHFYLAKTRTFLLCVTPKDERAGWISGKIENYSWRFGDSARANVSVFAVWLELNYAAGAASTSARAGEE